ncbi:MAG: ATP-binding cassette domain-containing protein [Candidatus Methanoliparum thermophilum]|uniref:ATP-binding cassette domain-containing protein n=1 Tax=Methanoliparum thermophilum TaxID=2491083 RepID=A0A520KSJ0_METT2|nr:MAG: ATP-binding cassette domain-containing protein [Candidatus Methanoliparum thermophilum]
MEDVIVVEGLTKRFGNFVAVNNIDFTVKEREIFGFLGPNGAGKSTTIKILITLLHPTSGSAKICGYDVVKEPYNVRKKIGVVFQDRSSDRVLTGRQNLDLHGRMYTMSKEEREKKIKEVLRLLELEGVENIRLNSLPEGVRRRFEVARGFMTNPKVVFLDEPTIGFDIKARRDLWSQIKDAKEKEGSAVLLTTHYIEEADYLCDRVAIIDHAKIVAIDTPENLKKSVGTMLISFQIGDKNGNGLSYFIDRVKRLDWVIGVLKDNNPIILKIEKGEGRVLDLIEFADKIGFEIISIDEREPNLEDAFLYYTGRTIREAEGG